jgi:hypothetical protein
VDAQVVKNDVNLVKRALEKLAEDSPELAQDLSSILDDLVRNSSYRKQILNPLYSLTKKYWDTE